MWRCGHWFPEGTNLSTIIHRSLVLLQTMLYALPSIVSAFLTPFGRIITTFLLRLSACLRLVGSLSLPCLPIIDARTGVLPQEGT
jgi:hypothetical protein